MRLWPALFLSSLLIVSLEAHDWSRTSAYVERSLVRISAAGRVCTGFSISERRGHVMTAHHCIIDDGGNPLPFEVNGYPSYPIYINPDYDLVVVWNVTPTPGLTYRRKALLRGSPVASLGFANSLPAPTLMAGEVSILEAPSEEGVWFGVNFPFIPGMSGGPVFDSEGRVVSFAQRTDNVQGIGRPLSRLLALTKRYWD